MEQSLDPTPTRCPTCGEPNGCAMASPEGARACWCASAQITADAMARVPDDRRGTVCVCTHCGQLSSDRSTPA